MKSVRRWISKSLCILSEKWKNYSIEMEKIMRDKYENGLIHNERDIKEALNNVLPDCERS